MFATGSSNSPPPVVQLTAETKTKEASLSRWFKAHLDSKRSNSRKEIDQGLALEKDDLTDILREWIFVKTRLSITIIGEKGIGKSFLVNTLLEASFQDVEAHSSHSSLDKDFFLVALGEKKGHNYESMVDDPVLPKDFQPSIDFDSQVNWSSEKEAKDTVQTYCITESAFNVTALDRHSFLLPQGPFGGLLPRDYTITHGRFAEMTISFLSEKELRSALWRVHEIQPLTDRKQMEFYRRQYKQLLELSREQTIPLPNVPGPAFLPIPKHILEVLGQVYRFQGTGMDPNLDRIYIREKLLEMNTRYGLAIKHVKLKFPSGVLEGNKELTVLDTEVLDPTRTATVLANTNLLLVAVDRRGMSDALSNMLKSSGFLDRMISESEEYKLAFLDLSEREEVASLLSVPHKFYFKSKEHMQTLKQQILSKLKRSLLEREQLSVSSFTGTDKLLQTVMVTPLKPLLFSSLNMHKSVTQIRDHVIADTKHNTNLPLLLAYIQNMVLSKCARPLQDFNKDWMLQHKESSTLLDRLSSFISKKQSTPTMEHLIASLQEHTKLWKADIAEFERSLYGILQSKAKETNYQLVIHNTTLQQFAATISQYWEKRVLEKLPQRSQDLLHFCLQLLDECPRAVKFPPDATMRDRTRLLKILKFCKSSTERAITIKLEELQQHNTQDEFSQTILNAFRDLTDGTHVSSKNAQHITEQGVLAVYKSASESLNFMLRHLEMIEKHVEDTIRLIIYSPNLTASQVMTFLISSQMQEKSYNSSHSELDPIINFQKQQGLLDLHRTLEVDKINRSMNAVLYTDSLWNEIHLSREYSMDLFKQQLKAASLKMVVVEADGNSQFRAFAHLVYGVQSVHTAIRLLLMHEILSNSPFYSKFLASTGTDFQEYVCAMSKENEYGDHITLFAFANFYNAELYIYSPLYPQPLKIVPENRSSNTHQHEAYYLAYVNKNQYAPLLQIAPNMLNVEEKLGKLQLQDHSTEKPLQQELAIPKQKASKLESSFAPRRTVTMHSLSDLCIHVICAHIDYLPVLEGALPEELVQKIISLLIEDGKLCNDLFPKLLDSSIISLSFDGYKQLNTISSKLIGSTCRSLRKLNLAGCVSMTSQDLINILSSSGPHLEELNLQDCYLLDEPAFQCIAKHCGNLSTLNIAHCSKLNDVSIDLVLSCCKRIRKLLANGCSLLSDKALHAVGNELQTLDISECPQLTDLCLLPVARNCPRLLEIKLSGKGFTDSGMIQLVKCCTALQAVELQSCDNISDAFMIQLQQYCQQINTMTLNACKRITDNSFISNKKALYYLKHLDLTRCLNLTVLTLKHVATCSPLLQSINLHSCEEVATDEVLITLSLRCKDLRSVNVSGCVKVTDKAIGSLAQNCLNLEKLVLLNCNKITDKSLEDIARGCPQLNELNVSSCEHVTDDGLLYLATSCHNLVTLYLEECKISDRGLIAIANGCPNIEALSLAYCKDLTEEALLTLARRCTNIKTLDLSYPKNISVQTVNKVIVFWPKLRTLNLRGYSNWVVEGIEHSNLQHLNLSWCKNVTDTAVAKIAIGCPSLESLHLTWCSKLTSNSVHTLTRKLPNLRVLNLRGCNQVSVNMLKHMVATGKYCVFS